MARASVEMVSPTECIKGVSQVAARPMAWGKTVAMPERATPCSPSFHQVYSGMPKPGNGRRGHGHLGDLLLWRQAPYQVSDALLDGQRGVLKGIIRSMGVASEKPQKQVATRILC